MSDGIPHAVENVLGVLTDRIEARFAMCIDALEAAVAEVPTADPEAAEVVKWYGLLVEAQAVLDRTEDALLAALENQPSEVDDPRLELAERVNAAVTARDGRALVVRWLLDPDAPGKRGAAAEGPGRLLPMPGPAVQTSAPYRFAGTPAPGPRAGRSVR
ncbi:hypothetical protein ACIQAC_34025 [Streptomyces sp. NPDC088387]|uniref:hypothetical protein n=1 Tax=Streptomyces sp. NPDC088387 TaxID=3365859 RepID=UPI00382A8F55